MYGVCILHAFVTVCGLSITVFQWIVFIYIQYSSWPGDIRSSYKAVVVDTINTLSGRSETVRLSNEYVPLPPDDRLANISL